MDIPKKNIELENHAKCELLKVNLPSTFSYRRAFLLGRQDALKNMETSSRIISESEKSAKINCKHEVDQDKCTICNDPQCKRTALDLDELERKLDQALNNETNEI